MEDPDVAKQNDRDSATRPLTDIPTKLPKQGFDVPPRQAAANGTGEDQLKGALVPLLKPRILLPCGTRWIGPSTACRGRITPAITWPPKARKTNRDHLRAAQMYGIDSRFPGSITNHLVEGRCAWRFATTSWGQSLRRHGSKYIIWIDCMFKDLVRS